MKKLYFLLVSMLLIIVLSSCAKPSGVFHLGKTRSATGTAQKNAEIAQTNLGRIEEINSEIKETLRQIESIERSAQRTSLQCR